MERLLYATATVSEDPHSTQGSAKRPVVQRAIGGRSGSRHRNVSYAAHFRVQFERPEMAGQRSPRKSASLERDGPLRVDLRRP
jgi:hypothetical protein